MKDGMKSCEHTVPEDVQYKEVVIIGNGPSGLVTSFMLAGNVPYLKDIPEDLPIDDMLRARLSTLPPGQNLYDTDLMALAEGLEGRSQNPIPLLMDNLLRPCADMGIQADPLIEWKFDIEKQIDHIVLGKGPPGGSWHTFPGGVRSLSPGAWLSLPPHAPRAPARLPARAVASYCRRYVHACQLQRYFRSGVVVTSVTRLPASGVQCDNDKCPLKATFCVTGVEKWSGRGARYWCRRVVCSSGAALANTLANTPANTPALSSLAALQRALPTHGTGTVLIVGSGVSAADAVWLTLRRGLSVVHLHRTPAEALARLNPDTYPDYCQVYKMMSEGASANYTNYKSYPYYIIDEVNTDPTQLTAHSDDIEEYSLAPKQVKIINLKTNHSVVLTVNAIGVFIGSRPDLTFLQTNYTVDIENNVLDTNAKRKMEEKQNFLKNHWHYLKSVLGQSIQSCKSRYLNYTEVNDYNDDQCIITESKCTCVSDKFNELKDCETYTDVEKMCDQTERNPFSSGIGYGIDPSKPVDGKSNPVAIDKSTHELLNAPKGIYALGPLTCDNFVRFIPGGALAIVSHIHRNNQFSV